MITQDKAKQPMNVMKSYQELKSIDLFLLEHYFHFLTANITRTKTPFSMVFISLHSFDVPSFHEQRLEDFKRFGAYFQNQTRKSDFLFQISHRNEWIYLLPHSSQKEAEFFLKRIFQNVHLIESDPHTESVINLSAAIVTINNSHAFFHDVLEAGSQALQWSLKEKPFHFQIVEKFNERELETIKVSIIASDPITQSILQTLLQRTTIDDFELEIEVFDDGDQFLESSWYLTGHTHFILINDILPKKSGVEVLHILRDMPNTNKFLIFMISKGKSDEDILYGYEKGVDEYITKPFNVKIIESQLKRWLKRLR